MRVYVTAYDSTGSATPIRTNIFRLNAVQIPKTAIARRLDQTRDDPRSSSARSVFFAPRLWLTRIAVPVPRANRNETVVQMVNVAFPTAERYSADAWPRKIWSVICCIWVMRRPSVTGIPILRRDFPEAG